MEYHPVPMPQSVMPAPQEKVRRVFGKVWSRATPSQQHSFIRSALKVQSTVTSRKSSEMRVEDQDVDHQQQEGGETLTLAPTSLHKLRRRGRSQSSH